MSDKYPHLTVERVAFLRKRVIEIYEAGNGDQTFCDGEEKYGNMSVDDLVFEICNNHEPILDQLAYDIETGEIYDDDREYDPKTGELIDD